MILNDIPFFMIKCLVITITIEIVVAFILKIKDKKDFINILLVNVLTNPLVVTIPVYFNIRYGILHRNIVLAILEILTVIVEGSIYKKYLIYKKINPYMLSLILNTLSYVIGEIINYL